MKEDYKNNELLKYISYRPPKHNRINNSKQSIEVYGFDTEATTNGRTFMFATSEGDVWRASEFPRCLFGRKYRSAHFVTYNLRYDSGGILQHLPLKHLQQLQETDETELKGYKYKVVGNRYLSIRYNNHTVTFWDVFGFYLTSLNKASKQFLGSEKLDQNVKLYTKYYIQKYWNDIAEYCVQDAVLTRDLARILINKFEDFGVYPRKLYSTAYVSWQYFRNNCKYIHVKKYWWRYPRVLEYAMRAYNGGKFEVTRKGPGDYHVYDIVSAYPYEISNLVDIVDARVSFDAKIRDDAVYSFLECRIKIPQGLHSPVAVKRGSTNCYPEGEFTKVITLNEYLYLTKYGADLTILSAVHLHADRRKHPYREEILRLMKYKDIYKRDKRLMDYHTIKIFLNSLYGKMVQLIPKEDRLEAGAAWNPIYGAVITANTRIRVTEMQQLYPSIVAVHTDSITSTEPLQIDLSSSLGGWEAEVSGSGVILGSGVYQVGEKSKIRGFVTKKSLMSLIPTSGDRLRIREERPYSWRQVAFRGLDPELINLFHEEIRELRPDFDKKRIWIDDYNDFAEVRKRNVDSIALHLQGENDYFFSS